MTAQLSVSPLLALSPSGFISLFSCPRKWALTKTEGYSRDATIHTEYGSAYGAATAAMLTGSSLAEATVLALATYNWPITEEDTKSSKGFAFLVKALIRFHATELPRILSKYQVLSYKDKPAVELWTMLLDSETGGLWQGYIDIVLQDKETLELVTVDFKSTGSVSNPLTYMRSIQTISYSLSVDAIARELNIPAAAKVMYLEYNTKTDEFHEFVFPATLQEKAEAVASIRAALLTTKLYASSGFYPATGKCVAYGRECSFVATCSDSVRIKSPALPVFPIENIDRILTGEDKDYVLRTPDILLDLTVAAQAILQEGNSI